MNMIVRNGVALVTTSLFIWILTSFFGNIETSFAKIKDKSEEGTGRKSLSQHTPRPAARATPSRPRKVSLADRRKRMESGVLSQHARAPGGFYQYPNNCPDLTLMRGDIQELYAFYPLDGEVWVGHPFYESFVEITQCSPAPDVDGFSIRIVDPRGDVWHEASGYGVVKRDFTGSEPEGEYHVYIDRAGVDDPLTTSFKVYMYTGPQISVFDPATGEPVEVAWDTNDMRIDWERNQPINLEYSGYEQESLLDVGLYEIANSTGADSTFTLVSSWQVQANENGVYNDRLEFADDLPRDSYFVYVCASAMCGPSFDLDTVKDPYSGIWLEIFLPHTNPLAPYNDQVVLDGHFDDWTDNWQGLGGTEHVVFGRENYRGDADLSASYQVAWSEAGLWLALDVSDDVIGAGARADENWRNDGIEILLDRDRVGDSDTNIANADDYQFVVSINEQLTGLQAYRYFPSEMALLDVQGEVRPTESGYAMELLLPWELFEIEDPEVIPVYGFAIGINDNDSQTDRLQTLISSSPERMRPDRPQNWGLLILDMSY